MNLKNLTSEWHMMRVIRLAFSIWAAVLAIQEKEIFLGVVAVFLFYQVVTNKGCCMGQCALPVNPNEKKEN